ncbi:MFS transporter [Elizabethkingia meningoseptica]|uniref:MFS transporter n=1 Tax=Elizabethkingia meningoseptica TaxID=238 RepID=UPI0023AF312E|nr:MFS transporter [Elizabethkingia meningoseptica]MDE5469925.1 MFS transporter [Elizabethkingia meningoseptica]
MRNTEKGLLTAIALCILLASLGTSIVNISLPSLTTFFSASFRFVQWVVIAYLLAITVSVAIAGKLADEYGYRKSLLFGIAVFTLSSLLSTFVPTILLMIVLRLFQGMGAAVLSTVGMAIVKNNTEKEKIGTAMGLLGTMSAIGTAMGPSVGGLLLSNFGWPSIFLILAFLGGIAFLLGLLFIKKEKSISKTGQKIYFTDVILLSLSIGTYALAMTIGKDHFSIYTLALLLFSAFSGWSFFSVQRRRMPPLIDTGILKNKPLVGSLLKNFVVSNVMMATLIVGPFFLTSGLGLSETEVGWAMSVGPLISILTGIPSGKIVDKAGTELIMKISLFLLLTGTLCLALLPQIWGWAGYISSIVLLTPGYQLFQAANNTSVMSAAGEKQGGVVSGILNLSRNTGLVTGASLMGALFSISSKNAPGVTNIPDTMFFALKVVFLVASLFILPVLITTFSKNTKVSM